ncbi:MAG: hypothetical protein KAK00_08880 [Nanoarchaeota archaeon]|nr:hypothetical protein [Nanoarchaeota archaeon]
MGQASVVNFLKTYKKSEAYKKKQWLSVRDIYEKMKNSKHGSAISSMTTSIKKLRDSGMIRFKEMRIRESARAVMHYQVK